MRIVLYRNTAESTRVNKDDYIEELATIDGTFKTATDIINPVVIIEKSAVESFVEDSTGQEITDSNLNDIGVSSVDLLKCNYIYIEELERYYFVETITSVSPTLWSISAHVDVLNTYKGKIKIMNALVERNEFDFNPMLPDSELILPHKPEIRFEEHWTTNILNEATGYHDYTFVVSTIITEELEEE